MRVLARASLFALLFIIALSLGVNFVGWASGQQKPTDDQLEILGLQADLQKCQVTAEKQLRKLQKEIADLKAKGSN